MGEKPVMTAFSKDIGSSLQVTLVKETNPRASVEAAVVWEFEEDDSWDLTICPECGKKYSTVTHMKVHYRTHTGEKPYICPYEGCGKQFSVGYSLRTHVRVHTGDSGIVV